MEFYEFRNLMQAKFTELSKNNLYRTSVEGQTLWETYLKSFPPGTNPIYITRTEHDCSCCKQFIKAIGNVISLSNGHIDSLWNIPNLETPYLEVSQALHNLVTSVPIQNILLTDYKKVGTNRTIQHLPEGDIIWEHFQLDLPSKVVVPTNSLGTKLGNYRSSFDVFQRALNEISMEAITIVQDLITENNLYRGEQAKEVIEKFSSLKQYYQNIPDDKKDNFIWDQLISTHESISHIRNSLIGTLLVDLSNGINLQTSVAKYESKAAPYNYKRPKPLVTKQMVSNAQKKLEQLGFSDSIYRRPAIESDLNINDIYWANAATTAHINKSPFDSIIETLPYKPFNKDKLNSISISDFITNILPTAKSIELFMENRFTNNLASIIAPVHATAPTMFNWNNGFSWTYNNNVTDSITERVKKAGGNINAFFRASLSWFNTDDLDLHMIEPHGFHIHFGNKTSNITLGNLDVDMNVHHYVRNAVENISYPNKTKILPGKYQLFVHNFTRRESIDTGFEIELALNNNVFKTFHYDKPVGNQEQIPVADIYYNADGTFDITPHIPETKSSKTIWNITTESFIPVNLITVSPNYWKPNKVGNKHYFFILNNCKFDEPLRGFFNEYLHHNLKDHRKVFELLADKMKCNPEQDQLSGLGFSSTLRNEVIVKVSGSHTKIMKVTF